MLNGRFTSLGRSDLSNAIYGSLDGVETVFEDSIVAIDQEPEVVARPLRPGGPARGRSGHRCGWIAFSGTSVAFGLHSAFEVSLGYHIAAFELAATSRATNWCTSAMRSWKTDIAVRFARRQDAFLFIFRDEAPGSARGMARVRSEAGC
jgi:hypothetical protein